MRSSGGPDANPRGARGLFLGLTRRLMKLTRRLADSSARAELRVARLLLTLSERLGRSGEDGIRLPLALTRQEVAGLIEVTQETG